MIPVDSETSLPPQPPINPPCLPRHTRSSSTDTGVVLWPTGLSALYQQELVEEDN